MTGVTNILLFMVSCVLTHNFIFSRFLGCCPFLGVSKKVNTAASMGLAVTLVMTMASVITWCIYHLVLVPLDVTYLQTCSFILVIAALVQVIEMFLKKTSPALYKALGIYLPLITTNCAVLGVAVLNITDELNLGYAIMNGLFGGLGFMLAIVLMAGVQERIATSHVPERLKGFPISLICAGLIALAFMGFSGIG